MGINGLSFDTGFAPRALSSAESQWLNSIPAEMRGNVAQQLGMFRENELINYMAPLLQQLQGGAGGMGGMAGAAGLGGGAGLNTGDLMEQQQIMQEQKALQSLERKLAAESNKSSKMHDIAMAIINNLK